jgi:anti-sigma regulatory factor (Ser/Thr protein kinase)
VIDAPAPEGGFRHEAFFYATPDEYRKTTLGFVRDGLSAGEAVMVVLGADSIQRLRADLGADAGKVRFGDMAEIGRNPARIIPAWREFLDSVPAGHPTRGIGEPVWAGRGPAELAECHRHEALLNLAFESEPTFWLMCPYDRASLDRDDLDLARTTHPWLLREGSHGPSNDFAPAADPASYLAGVFDEPAASTDELSFGPDQLNAIRLFAARAATRAGLSTGRVDDLVLAVNEVVTNSLMYGGGFGLLRVWADPVGLVCEVGDSGRMNEPLAGRVLPDVDRDEGRGLWMANQVCDLVQIRSSAVGTVVRLHMNRA